jgi:gamma-glutamyltranspeptidase / glutathione hydrolase
VHLAQKYGSLPLPALLAPAIRAAREGFAVDRRLAQLLAWSAPRLSPAARAVFAPQGPMLAEGDRLRQPELAATLERLAAGGRAGFYAGETAAALVRAVRENGGIWSAGDLAGYRVLERKPVSFHFRDYRVVSAPPPSAGGIALAQALGMLEARGWVPGDSARSRHLVAEVLRRAYRERARLGDPAFVTVERERLLAREHLLALAREINPEAATPSVAPAPPGEGSHTTHFSILDAQGNRVAGTLSINLPFGSGFMAPGTGVLLNDEMDDFAASPQASNAYGLAGSLANAIAPGKRPLSSMSPTFVEGPRGLLILGTPGGSRIISMVLLGTLAFAHGASAAEVVALPRYHHQHLPDQIEYEPEALSVEHQSRLNAMGHRLRAVSGGYGNMQAVHWDVAADTLAAASDPRGVGAAAVQRTREAAPPP